MNVLFGTVGMLLVHEVWELAGTGNLNGSVFDFDCNWCTHTSLRFSKKIKFDVSVLKRCLRGYFAAIRLQMCKNLFPFPIPNPYFSKLVFPGHFVFLTSA
jgi:hypothetical protein